MKDKELEALIFGEEKTDFLESVREKLQKFVDVLNAHNNTNIYDFTLPYSDYYKTFYIALGTKVSANDETTLLACTLDEENEALEVVAPLLEDDGNTVVQIDENFSQNFASILRNLLKEKVVKEKLYIYNRLYSKDQFVMTVFAYERFRYIPENRQLLIDKENVKKLKAGDQINLQNDLFERWNKESCYESEVNGIIAYVYFKNEQWYACVKRPTKV